MWILDINPEEIKNPYPQNDDDANWQHLRRISFDAGVKAILAHAHKVDLDETMREYVRLFVRQCPEISLMAFIEKCPFSPFLQLKMQTQEKTECKDKTKHQLKYLGGEKESYYLATCKICGNESYVPSYIVRDAQEEKSND